MVGHSVMEIPYPWNVRLAGHPELGRLGMFLYWSCFHCVWRYGGWEGGEGMRKNNKAKAKLKSGIERKPSCL